MKSFIYQKNVEKLKAIPLSDNTVAKRIEMRDNDLKTITRTNFYVCKFRFANELKYRCCKVTSTFVSFVKRDSLFWLFT